MVTAPGEATIATGDIHQSGDLGQLVEANASPGNPDRMQYTAETATTYVVAIQVLESGEHDPRVDVEIYRGTA